MLDDVYWQLAIKIYTGQTEVQYRALCNCHRSPEISNLHLLCLETKYSTPSKKCKYDWMLKNASNSSFLVQTGLIAKHSAELLFMFTF